MAKAKVKEKVVLDKVERRVNMGGFQSATIHYIATINGKTFGYDAEVRASVGGFGRYDDHIEVQAGQPSIGNADPRIAMIRAMLYIEAAREAAVILKSLEAGTDLMTAVGVTEQEILAGEGIVVSERPSFASEIRLRLGAM